MRTGQEGLRNDRRRGLGGWEGRLGSTLGEEYDRGGELRVGGLDVHEGVGRERQFVPAGSDARRGGGRLGRGHGRPERSPVHPVDRCGRGEPVTS